MRPSRPRRSPGPCCFPFPQKASAVTTSCVLNSLRAATRTERRALLAGNAATDGHVPAGTGRLVLRRMQEAGWITGFTITDAGRRAALTVAQRKALTAAVSNGGSLAGVPHATVEALVRNGCAERHDTRGRVTAERGGAPFATAAGLRAVTPAVPDAAPGPETGTPTPGGPLSDEDRAVLGMEGRTWPAPGPKERAIREVLDMSTVRYYQFLNALLDDPRAANHAPITVNRLRAQREADRARRS